jgi:hypothetical protein
VFFGLNKEPIFEIGLAVGEAEGEATGAGEAFFRARCSAGEADAIGLAVGDGEASVFLRPRVFTGEAEASGLAIGDGDVSAFLCPRVFAGDAEASGLEVGEVSTFLRPRFFGGEADASGLALGDGVGLCASTSETQAKMVINKSRARLAVMERRLEVRREIRQRQSLRRCTVSSAWPLN